MQTLTFWLKAARAQVLPVMILPITMGSVAAYAWDGTFHLFFFLLTLIGALAAHLFSNMINDLWDFRNGVDTQAEKSEESISTNSRLLANGKVGEGPFAFVTWALFVIAFVSGLLLAILRGWELLLFAIAGGLIAYFYVAPPLKFGYRGKGYSEIAIFLAFGMLPITGSYFVMTRSLPMEAFLLSIPIGLFTTLILFNHHFLHWRADQEAGKKTLVVLWGEKGGLIFSKSLAALAFLSILCLSVIHVLPWYAIVALVAAIPLASAYRKLGPTNKSPVYGQLMGASLKATTRTGIVIVVSLLIYGII
ncbi:prenyltransferase [Bacillus sp. C1-1]|nr:prenyltransferase [Bacillus sp. C1-1]